MALGGFTLGADFEFSGLEGVLDQMTAFERRVIDAADEAVDEAARDGADLVAANAPVDTGRLRATATHTKRGWAFALIEVGEGVAHTRPQEARTKFFNRSIAVVQQGLAERVVNKIKEQAF